MVSPDLCFVYGTLRRGFSNHAVMQQAGGEFVGNMELLTQELGGKVEESAELIDLIAWLKGTIWHDEVMPKPPQSPLFCVYCGEPAPTKDHVPPKCIFPRPRSSNLKLIKVPSCQKCNGDWSKADEEFRVFLSLKVGMDGEAERRLHKEAVRTVSHNQKIRREIQDRARLVDVMTPEGLITGKRYVIPFQTAPLKEMALRIAKGLYFHHFRERIPDSHTLSANIKDEPDDVILDLVKNCSLCIIGENQEFLYAYGRTPEHASAWVMLFFQRFLVVVLDIPPDA